MADFGIGNKVREKSGRGPLMIVKRITSQGYIVCRWHGLGGRHKEKMFFEEMLVMEPGPQKGTGTTS